MKNIKNLVVEAQNSAKENGHEPLTSPMQEAIFLADYCKEIGDWARWINPPRQPREYDDYSRFNILTAITRELAEEELLVK